MYVYYLCQHIYIYIHIINIYSLLTTKWRFRTQSRGHFFFFFSEFVYIFSFLVLGETFFFSFLKANLVFFSSLIFHGHTETDEPSAGSLRCRPHLGGACGGLLLWSSRACRSISGLTVTREAVVCLCWWDGLLSMGWGISLPDFLTGPLVRWIVEAGPAQPSRSLSRAHWPWSCWFLRR